MSPHSETTLRPASSLTLRRPPAPAPPSSAASSGAASSSAARPPIPVKVLVSGGFGVGKTTMIGALSEIEPLTTEAAMTSLAVGIDAAAGAGATKTSTTVAMDFGRVTIDETIILYLFGTPGQDRFSFMWNDLANGALGGVVLVDTTALADCFVALDYFEKIGLPFVVAVNQFDGQENLTLEQVRHATDVDPAVPVVAVDARSRESVKQVVLGLLNVVLERARSASAVPVEERDATAGIRFPRPPSGRVP